MYTFWFIDYQPVQKDVVKISMSQIFHPSQISVDPDLFRRHYKVLEMPTYTKGKNSTFGCLSLHVDCYRPLILISDKKLSYILITLPL